MAEFSFDEFVNEVMGVLKSDNGNSYKDVLSLTFKKMNELCPGSYMPFFFAYAQTHFNLHFVPVAEGQKVQSSLTLSQTEFDKKFANQMRTVAQTIATSADVVNYDFIINHINEVAPKLHAGLYLNNMINTFGEDKIFCWDFHGYSDDYEENPEDSDFYEGEVYHRLQNALDILQECDPFFKTKFDKYLYFELIGLLPIALVFTPEFDTSNIYDIDDAISYYKKNKNWLDFYDDHIMKLYIKHHADYKDVPEGVTKIVNGLLHDGQGSEYNTQYDPFNNMGVFALNVNAQMSNPRDQRTPHALICDETDDETMCALTVRMLLRDCYVEFGRKEDDKRVPNYVSMPPFNEKDVKDTIQMGVEYAYHGSKMVCIVPSTVLFASKYEESRKLLINSKYLTKIVLLPEKTMTNTNGAVSIVYVDGSKESDNIKLVDASDFVLGNGNILCASIANLSFHDEYPERDEVFHDYDPNIFEFGIEVWNEECQRTDGYATQEFGDREDILTKTSFKNNIHFVSKDDAKENGCSLNPALYFDRRILAQEGYRMVRLSEILTPVDFRVEEPVNGKFISAKDLQESSATQEINVDSLVKENISKDYLVVKPGTSIIATKVGSLRPSVLHSNEVIYANAKTVQAFYLKEDCVNGNYLVNEMCKEYFNTLLHYTRMYSHRNGELELDKLRVQVPLPSGNLTSLEIQRNLIEKDLVVRLDVLGRRLKSLSDQRFNEYIIALRQRKHRLAQILNQVCPAFNLLNKTRVKNSGILKDTDVVASRTGENVALYFGKVQQGLDKIERLIETFVDKNQWGKAEKFSLEEFVSEFKQRHICKNYKIQLSLNNISDAENVDTNEAIAKRMVNMPKDELSTVLENIIANAETWGFNDRNRDDYAINISLDDADNGEYAIIRVANNGTPIHPSVDRNHIFDWGVGNHTGVGTWQAKNIVEHYGGHIRINEYPDAKDRFQTEYEITLQREY